MEVATFNGSQDRHLSGLNSGHFTWNITDKQLLAYMLKCAPGQGFQSKPFKMSNLHWKLTLFPNGETAHNEGDSIIYLSLQNMPQSLQAIHTSSIMQCAQTGVGHSSLDNITRHQMSVGGMILPLSLLQVITPSSPSISFTVSINILSLKMPPNRYLTQFHLDHVPPPNSANAVTNTNCSWTLNPDMFHEITCNDCDVGQRFISPIYDNLWQLQCQCDANTLGIASRTYYDLYGQLPLNVEITGNIGLYLKMVNPPPTVQSVDCTVTFSCPQIDAVERIQFTFQRTNGFESGIDDFIRKSDVRLKDLESITFIVEMEVIDVIESEAEELQNEGTYDSRATMLAFWDLNHLLLQ